MKDRYKELMKRSVSDAQEIARYDIGQEGTVDVGEEFVVNIAMALYSQRAMEYNYQKMAARQAESGFQGNPDMGRM